MPYIAESLDLTTPKQSLMPPIVETRPTFMRNLSKGSLNQRKARAAKRKVFESTQSSPLARQGTPEFNHVNYQKDANVVRGIRDSYSKLMNDQRRNRRNDLLEARRVS